MKKNYEVDERYLKVVPINLHSFVKIVGIECYEKIVEEYGGGGIYIPSQKKHDISKRIERYMKIIGIKIWTIEIFVKNINLVKRQ